MRHLRTVTWAFLAALLCLTATAAADTPALQKGVLLVAGAQIADPRFNKSVILITDYSDAGAAGVIINRPTATTLSELFPGTGPARADRLHYGGPVMPRAVFVFAHTTRAHPRMHPVMKNIYTTMGLRALQHILAVLQPDEEVRAYAGYTGWAPGQLDAELARGDWILVPAESGLIFTREPEKLWEQLIRRWSGQWV